LEDELVGALRARAVGFQRGQEAVDAGEEAVVDDALVFQRGYLVPALGALLVDLVLFGADEGAFVDVGVDFDVGIIAELEGVLGRCVSSLSV